MLRLLADDNNGFALLITLVVTTILVMLGGSLASLVIFEGRSVGWQLCKMQAFYLAEAAGNKAVRLIREGAIEDFPYSENNVALENGQYSLDIDFESGQIGAYIRDIYTITSTGEVNRVKYRTRMEYQQNTFLRFSRFVQNDDLSYNAYAVISGDTWVGNNLNLTGYPVTFLGDVLVGGVINNYSNGIFHGSVTQGATPIDLQMSVDLTYYSNLAQGNITGAGTGIYQSSSSTIDFSLFDFSGPIPKYNGNNLTDDFNGVIYIEGDAYVKGTLEGGSITVIASDDIVVEDHVRTSNMATGWTQTNSITFNSPAGVEDIKTVSIDSIVTSDTTVVKLCTSGTKWNKMKMELLEDGGVIGETYLVRRSSSSDEQMATISNLSLDPSTHSYSAKIYYKSTGTGDNLTWVRAYTGAPVNIGLVAKDMVYIDSGAPKQLIIDAVLLARDNTWEALGNSSSHPDEYSSSWKLTINGPLITALGGSAGPWSAYDGTRKYNYDEDLVFFPPPHFPVPFGSWRRTYWKTIKPEV